MKRNILGFLLYGIFVISCSSLQAPHDLVEDQPAGHIGHQSHSDARTPVKQGDLSVVTGQEDLIKTYGIKVETLRLTSAGMMLDLRYRVVNPKLATAVTQTSSPVEIKVIDQATGHALGVDKTNAGWYRSRSKRIQPNRIFFVILDNTHQAVKQGSVVAITFGSIKVQGWRVE
ncbi:MAG: hypothetical protein HY200_10680 [Nitrospirae bacterium]|nr:hypothetical protein [Nitrospirota bacterium]MBI3595409.1 hypothetical protein [Nitrospirota bacterium]